MNDATTPTTTPSPPSAPGFDRPAPDPSGLASRGSRAAGAIIDGLIGAVAVVPLLRGSGVVEQMGVAGVGVSENATVAVLGLLVFTVLHGYLLATSGQTIGKRIVGTRIVSATDGSLLPLPTLLLLRYVPISAAAVIPFIGNFAGLVDIAFIAREDRRCLHDLIAGTKVVRA